MNQVIPYHLLEMHTYYVETLILVIPPAAVISIANDDFGIEIALQITELDDNQDSGNNNDDNNHYVIASINTINNDHLVANNQLELIPMDKQ